MTLVSAAGYTGFFSQVTLRFGILGLASGAAVGLVALGIVVAYRSSQVLNFSAGAMGALAAFIFYDLWGTHKVNWILALCIALLIGAALGAGTALTLILLRRASLLAKFIATLGLMSLAEGVIDVIWGGDGGQPNTFLPNGNVTITNTIVIPEDRLILIGIVIVLAVGLRLVYAKTLFGLATAAVSENRRIAAASGWSPMKIELINYSIAGLLSALAAILLAPIISLQASILALTVIPALAAALVGRFSSFGLAIGAALLIGVIQAELSYYQPNLASFMHMNVASLGGVPQMVPLLIIILALAAAGRTRPGRGEIFAKLPLPGSGVIRPVRLVTAVAVAGLLLRLLSVNWTDALIVTFATAIIILSVIVVTGYGGQLSLCQFALAGFGCWSTSYLISEHNVPFGAALLVGIVGAMILGLVVALLAVRTRGVNFAIITLGLASVLEAVIFDNPSMTGGFNGFTIPPPHLFGINLDPIMHARAYGAFTLILLVIAGLLVANVRRGHTGRRLLAVRSNERAAASLGIGVFGAKLYAFALAGALAGLGGVLLGLQNTYVQLQGFDVFSSVQVVLFAVFGGIGWPSGAVAGASSADGGLGSQIVQTIFSQIGTIDFWLLIFAGLSVVVVLRSAPDGLAALNSQMVAQLKSRLGAGSRRLAPAGATRLVFSAAKVTGAEAVTADGSATTAGTPVEAVASTAAAQPAGALEQRPGATLEVRDITVRFGGLVAVDHVGFRVEAGEIVGLMGPNGAGKTTILDVITGFTPAASGDVVLDGKTISAWTPERRSRAGVVRSWQGVELFDEMTVCENLLIGADDHRRRRFVTDLVWPQRTTPSPLMEVIVEEFGISPYLDARPSALPHGIARLVGIARAAVSAPRVLLLDEPAAGLDVAETAELGRLLQRLASRGLGILVIEHDVALMRSACSRLVVMDFGKLVIDGTPDEVVRHPDVIRAYLGVEHGNASPPQDDGPPPETEITEVPGRSSR